MGVMTSAVNDAVIASEGRTDDDSDRQIDYVPAQDEVAKAFQHMVSLSVRISLHVLLLGSQP